MALRFYIIFVRHFNFIKPHGTRLNNKLLCLLNLQLQLTVIYSQSSHFRREKNQMVLVLNYFMKRTLCLIYIYIKLTDIKL